MTQVQVQLKLIDRLEGIRRSVRRRLVLYGVFAVASGGVYAFLTVVLLDWALDLPAVPRLAIGLVFVLGFVLASLHWVARPLGVRIGIEHIAGRLERHFTGLQDRLSSAVSFVRRRDAGSAVLMQRVLQNTDQVVADLPLESALTLRPLMVSGILLAVSGALMVGVAAWMPGWVSTGLGRYADPFGAIEWPRRVEIVPLTWDLKVPVGEGVTCRMRVARGLDSTLRGVVHYRDASGQTRSLAMRRDEDAFTARIEPVVADLTYWFEAGDDDTQPEASRIAVVSRPAVAEATLTIAPPAYAAHHTPRVAALTSEPIEVPVGSRVELRIRSSKPVAREPAEANALQLADGSTLRLVADESDPRQVGASFVMSRDVQFRIKLTDTDGYASRLREPYRLIARPDEPPVVELIEPRASPEVTPMGVIPVVAQIEDDFGISSVFLRSSVVRRSGGSADAPPATSPDGQASGAPDEAGTQQGAVDISFEAVAGRDTERVGAVAQTAWELAPLNLSAGSVVRFSIAARDNHPGIDGAGPGQLGESASLTARIIGAEEYARRVRERLDLLRQRIRRALIEQESAVSQISRLVREDASDPAPLTEDEQAALRASTTRESRLGRDLAEVGRGARTLARQMKNNRVHDATWLDRVESLAATLIETASGPMAEAHASLETAREAPSAATEQAALHRAVDQAQSAAQVLRRQLERMSKWSDFQAVLTRLRDLKSQQDSLRDRTAATGRSMVGKPVESLTGTERDALERLATAQEWLTEVIERVLRRMREQADAAGAGSPEDRAALQEALDEAESNELSDHLTGAVNNIRKNRTASAGIDQQASARAMDRMVRDLQRRETRALDELRKKVEQVQDVLADLLKQQRALRAAAGELASTGASVDEVQRLAPLQRQLRTNTRWVGEELADVSRAEESAQRVREALEPMARAGAALELGHAQNADAPQGEAVDLLQDALDRLTALADAVRREALQRSLDQIQEDLEALLTAQRQITAGIGALADRVGEATGRLTRAGAREASKLSAQQRAVHQTLDDIRPDLAEVPVFDWALGRSAGWMEDVSDRLARRRIDDTLTALSERIEHALETLIEAIRQTESMVTESEFAEGRGGGAGGGGAGQKQKPIPTVTELIVLRTIQTDINERTRAIGEQAAGGDLTEEQSLRLRRIGEDQAQLRALAQKVTQKARNP